MLYEFTVENFKSFAEPQTLSLLKGKQRNKLSNIAQGPAGLPPVVRTAAIYGHNASGKSNLVLAIHVFVQNILNSATAVRPDAPVSGIVPHRLTAEAQDAPTRFEAAFSVEQQVFRYKFGATTTAIVEESLEEELPTGRKKLLFNRMSHASNSAAAVVEFTDEYDEKKGFDSAARNNVPKLTRANALLLSAGASLNVPLLSRVYKAVADGVHFMVAGQPGQPIMPLMMRSVHEDARFRAQLIALLRDADVGIRAVRAELGLEPAKTEAEQIMRQLTQPNGPLPAEVAENVVRQMRRDALYAEHQRADGQTLEFDWNEESQGTRRLADIFWLLYQGLQAGRVVVIDEFASNIHPLLAWRLIELFQNPANNPNGAQLIFTTHESGLLSSQLLRKDQIWFVEKNTGGASELTRLDDFKSEKYTRSSEAFERNYLAGRYHGVGQFGPVLSGVPLSSIAVDPEVQK